VVLHAVEDAFDHVPAPCAPPCRDPMGPHGSPWAVYPRPCPRTGSGPPCKPPR
jgi:hypothetical protein